MDIDMVIEGHVFANGGLEYKDIGISDGKIVLVKKSIGGTHKRISFGPNKIILPGFVDPHVHFRDPGMTNKEDFSTGSLSAIYAGVTCVLDMPNTKPPIVDLSSLCEKKTHIRGRSYTDYGLLAAVTPNCDINALSRMVPGFKLFMGSTTNSILFDDDIEMLRSIRSVLSANKRISVHAEYDALILHDNECCTRDHLNNRPAQAEWRAISLLAQNFNKEKINICHITTPEGLDIAKSAGFTTEVTMHHLLFDIDKCIGTEYKTNPPIRDVFTRDIMFKRFVDGDITMIGTDHAPHTVDEKCLDFNIAPAGIPNVETTIPIVMNMVHDGTISLDLAVHMGAIAPALAFGMKKGNVSVGYDADFAIFDMHHISTINVKKMHSKCGYNPYAGMKAIFPDTVMVRGEIQIKDTEFCGESIGVDICEQL